MLAVGSKVPAFTLPDSYGKMHSLADYKGKYVVLYFYPRDDTPGCTKEACDFRDALVDFSKKNAVIIGVSADTSASHVAFTKKFGLPFVLLADTEKKTIQGYKAWGERSMYGRKFMGILRTTYVISPEGKIVQAFGNVKVPDHVKTVLASL